MQIDGDKGDLRGYHVSNDNDGDDVAEYDE